jgi:hypothetical protein
LSHVGSFAAQGLEPGRVQHPVAVEHQLKFILAPATADAVAELRDFTAHWRFGRDSRDRTTAHELVHRRRSPEWFRR